MATDDKKKKSLGQRLGQAAGEKVAMAKLAYGATEAVAKRLGSQAEQAVGGFVKDVAKGFSEGNIPVGTQPTPAPSPVQSGAATLGTTPNVVDQARAQAQQALKGAQGPVYPDGSNIKTVDADQQMRLAEQYNAPRGPETQTTRFGAFDSAGKAFGGSANQRNQASSGISGGSQTPDSSGTGAQSSVSNNPIAQLAKMRELREPSTGSGVTFVPNSYANERNARLNDPNRKLVEDLDRQVRLGKIAPKNAYRIVQDAIAQQQSNVLGQQKLDQAALQSQQELAYKDRALASTEDIARQKLAGDISTAAADRASEEAIAAGKRVDTALGRQLDIAKFQEDSAMKRERLGFDAAKFMQEQQTEAAKMYQQGNIEGAKNTINKTKAITDLVTARTEGRLGDEDFMRTLNELGGSEMVKRFFPDF